MMNRLFILCFLLALSLSNKAYSQAVSIGVNNVIHPDTLETNSPFYIDFVLTNLDTIDFEDIINVKLGIASVNDTSIYYEENLITINQFLGLEAGESLSLSVELIETVEMYQQSGDNLVVIWPSSLAPLLADSSLTPVFIKGTTSTMKHYTKEEKKPSKIIDLLGREFNAIEDIPNGSIYIRDSKKFFKKIK